GFALGLVLGPVGWIIAALLDYPLKCPVCKSGVPTPRASVVLHQTTGEFHAPITNLQLLRIATAMDRVAPQSKPFGAARHAAKGANPFAPERRLILPPICRQALDCPSIKYASPQTTLVTVRSKVSRPLVWKPNSTL